MRRCPVRSYRIHTPTRKRPEPSKLIIIYLTAASMVRPFCLIIVYLLYISLWDKLIVYSILLVLVSVIIRIVYGVYCNKHFAETHYVMVHDKKLVKEMTSFAWWGFFGNAAWMFNTQGVNILINIF